MTYKKGELLGIIARGSYWHCFDTGMVVKYVKMDNNRDIRVQSLTDDTTQTLSPDALVSIKNLTKLEKAFYGL